MLASHVSTPQKGEVAHDAVYWHEETGIPKNQEEHPPRGTVGMHHRSSLKCSVGEEC